MEDFKFLNNQDRWKIYAQSFLINSNGGESFNNSASVSIEESSNITLILLLPYTFGEQLTNFTNTYITPIIGIWTFLAGVGAVIAQLIIRAYNNRKQNKDIEY